MHIIKKMNGSIHIEKAYWLKPGLGELILASDWKLKQPPHVRTQSPNGPALTLTQACIEDFASQSGYGSKPEGGTFFSIPAELAKKIPGAWTHLYLACDLNQWGQAADLGPWELKKTPAGYRLDLQPSMWPLREARFFKFLTDTGYWLHIPEDAPNAQRDPEGNLNYCYWPHKTGLHCFHFKTSFKQWHLKLFWPHADHADSVFVEPGPALINLKPKKPLGVFLKKNATLFRLFAPRATAVWVGWRKDSQTTWQWTALEAEPGGTWTHSAAEALLDYQYVYRVDGPPEDPYGHWDPQQLILDPYARACVHPSGPGLIIDPKRFKTKKSSFKTPPMHELVILEAHVRDLLGLTHPEANTPLGFEDLTSVLSQKTNYISQLGVNALELQPLQEFDAPTPQNYHWGYMTTNAFSPASSFFKNPQKGSQIEAVQALVSAAHQAGIAVILDVVYNHVGEPNHLLHLDKYLYFRQNPTGKLQNASGCGNDLRCEAPAVTDWILSSLQHWVEVYQVDGFRFDLAELLTVEVLEKIQTSIQAIKPDILLIAEPWSFRGHCALALKQTDYACWNDGYRDFIASYVLEKGNQEGIRYFFSGCTDHLTQAPWQSINYSQSHDDYAWIDRITENPKNDGSRPTQLDIRRSHLMFALLLCSLGTPLLASGQDFLHSKKGVHNTYQRPDLNALSLERLLQHSATHAYVRGWIAFRKSPLGALLRLQDRPSPGYLQFFNAPHRSAMAVLINADLSHPSCPHQLLFAINPHDETLPIGLDIPKTPTLLADPERIDPAGLPWPQPLFKDGVLQLPALTCYLFKV